MDYRKALEQAIIYIETHLGDELRVEDAAAAAGYSYYHLNRQFAAVLGESVGSYIKKRRLADGSKKLLYTDQKIIDIAVENGFGSAEAFSRAFKAVYKVSPQGYRENRLDAIVAAKQRLDQERLKHLACNVTVHPEIVEIPPVKVAGMRGETTLCNLKVKNLWKQISKVYKKIPNRTEQERFFGVCEAASENTLYTMNDQVVFTEVVGAEVTSFEGLGSSFVQKVLPGGRYAVFTHRGSLDRLPQTYTYIWGTWFLNTREEVDWREDFELYDARFQGYNHPDSEMDLYIPIR